MAKKKAPTATHDAMGDPERLAAQLDTYKKARAIFLAWVKETLVPGQDWMLLHRDSCRTKEVRDQIGCPNCGAKATLLKPGAEKITGALHWIPSFSRDQDTWEMLGSVKGVLAYKCVLKDQITGQPVGEGRGTRNVAQDGGVENTAVKMASKSAFVDSVIRAAGLSEIMTQDLEDLTRQGGKGVVRTEATGAAAGSTSNPTTTGSADAATSPAAPPDGLPPIDPNAVAMISPDTMKLLRQMAVPDGGYPDFERRREAIKAYLAERRLTRLDGLSDAQGKELVAKLEEPVPPQPKGKNGGLSLEMVRDELSRVLVALELPGDRVRGEAEQFIARVCEVPAFDNLSPERALHGVDELRELAARGGTSALKLAMDRAARVEP